MIDFNPLLACDFYKSCHADQYPKSLTKMVSYYTPRMSRIPGVDKLTMFGLQAFIDDYLVRAFNDYFFNRDIDDVVCEYSRWMNATLGTGGLGRKRLLALHELGYLPLEIRALAEGVRSNVKVPQIEISNTDPNYVWLVNAIETMLSCTMWHTQVSAEVGYTYRQIANKYADLTCDDSVVRGRLIGDFSMRGQESVESAAKSSAAFCLSFLNTATVPSILWLEDHYDCDVEKEQVAFGAVSTEHSVMCSNLAIDGDERTHIKRLLTEIYPKTSFSMVSDSYDYWNLVKNILPTLKDEILNHDGYIAIRGDSGDPVEIVTQTVFELWKIFGGTTNSKGFKVLNPHVKAIYGDSITPQRCEKIYQILYENGFAINNVVLGMGSFSLQCSMEAFEPEVRFLPHTRDTFGIAVKATYAEDDDGVPVMIFKDPITDTDNFKKSQRGCCRVSFDGENYFYSDGLTWAEAREDNELKTVFKDGYFVRRFTLAEVRTTLHNGTF